MTESNDRRRGWQPRKGDKSRGDKPWKSSQRDGRRGESTGQSRRDSAGNGRRDSHRKHDAERSRDARPAHRPQFERGPDLPDDIDLAELEQSVRADLRALPAEMAEYVGKHLVMARRLVDDDPELALRHAQAARQRASRLAVVREAAGVAAYHAEEWEKALSELRTARRLTNSDEYLPMIVDSERALGRRDKAEKLLAEARERELPAETAAELALIAAGMRQDVGDVDGAVTLLSEAVASTKRGSHSLPRLCYAIAELFLSTERISEAREWFIRAADADVHDLTDAGERVLELDGVQIDFAEDDEEEAQQQDEEVSTSEAPTPSEVSLCEKYDVALIDIDGVVINLTEPIPGAAEGIAAAREAGMRIVFVTNNASRAPRDVAALLKSVGVEADESDVFTAARAAALHLSGKYDAGARVLVAGSDALWDEIAAVGLQPVKTADAKPEVVVQGYSPHVGWAQLAESATAIQNGAYWLSTNMDATLPSPRGQLPGNGALVAAVAAVVGRQPDVVTGKPEPDLFRAAATHAGAERPLVVGDRLDTDIAGANAAGFDSLLVTTGVSTAEQAERATSAQKPTYVADSLEKLVERVE